MRKIFLDCGANRGQSIIQAKKQFGDDFEIHSFEAVPILYDKLIEKWKHDSKVYLYNNAVWDKKDKVKIYLSLGWSDSSTLYLEKKDRPITSNIYNEIESIDISDFIQTNFLPEDYIILKLDIEGAEYDVLLNLIQTGVLGYVDELWGEWHDHTFDNQYYTNILQSKIIEIEKGLDYYNLEFKEWSAYIVNKEEEEKLTLDASNQMPLNEIIK